MTALLDNTCNYHKGCFYGIVSPHYFFPVLISRIMNLWTEYLWYVQTVFYRPVWFPFRVVKWYLLLWLFLAEMQLNIYAICLDLCSRVNFFDIGSWRNLIINNENRNKADTKRILNNAKKGASRRKSTLLTNHP